MYVSMFEMLKRLLKIGYQTGPSLAVELILSVVSNKDVQHLNPFYHILVTIKLLLLFFKCLTKKNSIHCQSLLLVATW